MSIYGRWGDPITILRVATLDDVTKYERREPDKNDREWVNRCLYLVVAYDDSGEESITHLTYLRADGGAAEIDAAIAATKEPQ